MKVKNDHRSKFSNLSNWNEEAWKNQGFNGIWTRDLRDTGAMLYQLSFEATNLCFLLPFLWPRYPIYDRCSWHSCPKHKTVTKGFYFRMVLMIMMKK